MHFCVVLSIFVLFYVFLCYSMYCLFCDVLCILFVCKCVLYYGHRLSTHLQLTKISYHIMSYHIIFLYSIIYTLEFFLRWLDPL
jgi:hypothetical protein